MLVAYYQKEWYNVTCYKNESGGCVVTPFQITLLVILVVVAAGCIALYFLGKRAQKKQEANMRVSQDKCNTRGRRRKGSEGGGEDTGRHAGS